MNEITKKRLIIGGAITVVVIAAILIAKKKKKENQLSTTNTNNDGISTNDDAIGKNASAIKELVYVMPDANILSFLAIPNGILSKGENAGKIIATTIGKDDNKLWYNVLRETSYTCPIWKCGLGAFKDNKSGWVLASELKIV